MDDLEDFAMQRLPTAERPLLRLTVLAVEDSRFACEAIRLMCLRSNARIRRADLIKELSASSPRGGVIIGTSGDDNAREEMLAAWADGFLAKPVSSLAEFQECNLQHVA